MEVQSIRSGLDINSILTKANTMYNVIADNVDASINMYRIIHSTDEDREKTNAEREAALRVSLLSDLIKAGIATLKTRLLDMLLTVELFNLNEADEDQILEGIKASNDVGMLLAITCDNHVNELSNLLAPDSKEKDNDRTFAVIWKVLWDDVMGYYDMVTADWEDDDDD